MYMWDDGTYLAHHGIKGQKWGIRRFQNPDGSLTSEGKVRYGLKERLQNVDQDKLKNVGKYALAAAAIGTAAYLVYKNPEAVKNALKKVGDKTVSTLSASMERAGQAMVDGAMMSMGGIAITHLAEKLPTDDSVDRATRERNQVIFDSTSAGIKAATNANSGSKSGSGNSNGGNVGKEVTDKLGAPSKQPVNKSTAEWQNLFKDSQGRQRDDQTRATIKSLASAGYDISQIRSYLDMVDRGTIAHSWNDGTFFLMSYSPYGRWTC